MQLEFGVGFWIWKTAAAILDLYFMGRPSRGQESNGMVETGRTSPRNLTEQMSHIVKRVGRIPWSKAVVRYLQVFILIGFTLMSSNLTSPRNIILLISLRTRIPAIVMGHPNGL